MGILLEKYTTHKIHTKLHVGTTCHIFHILTSEDIDSSIMTSLNHHEQFFFHCFRVCANSCSLPTVE